jgi:mannose-6-phosphate isomerase-like protein (cupin superfamily)
MDAKAIVTELEKTYPGKLIKQLPADNPTEIVCEFDPRDQHPDFSIAVAIIDRSAPHFHNHTTEIYHILKGTLTMHVDGEEFQMFEGQEYTVQPGKIHWASGDAVWVEVYCNPGYSPDDHHLVN